MIHLSLTCVIST